jgi:hypothetical protein
MTIARIQSFAFSGIEAVPVEVQVQISSGIPAFLVVGLPDKAVGEARERVRAALTAIRKHTQTCLLRRTGGYHLPADICASWLAVTETLWP